MLFLWFDRLVCLQFQVPLDIIFIMKKTLILTAIIGLLVVATYIYFEQVGRLNPTVNETFISSSRIPAPFEGVRVVQLSDLLIRSESCVILLENTVNAVNQLDPNLVVFTGNLFLPEGLIFEQEVSDLLGSIEANLARVVVFGNHDVINEPHFERVQAVFESAGFIDLTQSSVEIFNQAYEGINLIGGAPGLDRDDLDRLLTNEFHDERFNLLLLNDPTFASISIQHGIDLQLSGLCLGSQDPTSERSPCFQFYHGFYQFTDEITLHVSAGLARFHNLSGFRRQPAIDSFLLIRE